MPSTLKHLWRVVSCKTSDCKNLNAVKYHGLDIGQNEAAADLPTAFSYLCSRCGQTHEYDMEETWILSLHVGPPTGWTNAV